MKAIEKVKPAFDMKSFLPRGYGRRKMAAYGENAMIFSQGEPADAIFYIHKGKVKLTVFSRQGKEAVVGILGAGDFFGEGCLAGQPLRMGTSVALSGCSITRLEKSEVIRALHEQPSELNPKLASGRLCIHRVLLYIGSKAMRFEVRRQCGQTRCDHHEVGIQRIHRLDVTIDGQTTDQTIGSERLARTNQPCKVG
jgi:hypothetical protein